MHMTKKKKTKTEAKRKNKSKKSDGKQSNVVKRKNKNKKSDGNITQTVRININTTNRRRRGRKKKTIRKTEHPPPPPIRQNAPIFHQPLAYDPVRSQGLLTNNTTAQKVKEQLRIDQITQSTQSPKDEASIILDGILSSDEFNNKMMTDENFKREMLKSTAKMTKGTPAGRFFRDRIQGVKRRTPSDESDESIGSTTKALKFEEEKEDETPNRGIRGKVKGYLSSKAPRIRKKKTKEVEELRKAGGKRPNEPNRIRKKPEKYSPS